MSQYRDAYRGGHAYPMQNGVQIAGPGLKIPSVE